MLKNREANSVSCAALKPGDTGFDRRIVQRYRVDANLHGFIEHRFERHTGQIIDLSAGGFRMITPLVYKEDAVPINRLDLNFGEIEYEGNHFGGFGQIVHYKETCRGLEIGFSWDPQQVILQHNAVVDLIRHLVKQRCAGSVSCKNEEIILDGHISHALAADLFNAINHENFRAIVVEKSATITDCGVDLLSDIQRRGFEIKYKQPEIQFIITRLSQAPFK